MRCRVSFGGMLSVGCRTSPIRWGNACSYSVERCTVKITCLKRQGNFGEEIHTVSLDNLDPASRSFSNLFLTKEIRYSDSRHIIGGSQCFLFFSFARVVFSSKGIAPEKETLAPGAKFCPYPKPFWSDHRSTSAISILPSRGSSFFLLLAKVIFPGRR